MEMCIRDSVRTARQMIERGGPEAVKKELKKAEDPLAALQEFCGVGPKVAACISLFGLGRMDAFPIDVWMRRVMNRLYGIDEKDVKGMKSYACILYTSIICAPTRAITPLLLRKRASCARRS